MNAPLSMQRAKLAFLRVASCTAPGLVVLLLAFVGAQAADYFGQRGLSAAAVEAWHPAAGRLGVIGLAAASLMLSVVACVLAIAVGTPAAIRLAFFAGRTEARLARAALGQMAGLPSIIVGLVGLAWITPWAGHTLLAGVFTLFLMVFPTYVLLVAAALAQEADQRLQTCRALGLTDRQFAYRVALPAVLPAVVTAAALALGKGLGEATAVSLVIGNIGTGALPGIFEPASTLTSAILKDHGGATGLHRSALFASALCLVALILVIHGAAAMLAAHLRRRLGV